MLAVTCACGIRHRVSWRHGGKTLRCKCGRETRIPDPGAWLAWAALGWAVVTTVMILFLSDRWTPATILAFGPRWTLLVPLIVALPLVVWLAPRRSLIVVGSIGLVAWFAMGWSWGVGRLFVKGSAMPLRLTEYNAQGGERLAPMLGEFMARWMPDVAVFEECGDSLAAALGKIPGANSRHQGALCLFSRLPIEATDTMDRSGFEATHEAGLGGSAAVWRVRLRSPSGPLAVVLVHLETPRKGFEPAMSGDFSAMEGNTIVRGLESERARRFVDADTLPVIVAGDFNQPVESAIFREYWGSLRDAWSDAGLGYGYTKRDVPKIRVRIDHVLTDGRWRATKVQVGDEPWSDHLPLIVDLQRVDR